jgi:hypothetical protein
MRCEPSRGWQAERVDAAVQRFARTGQGDLARSSDDPTGARLRVGPYVVYLTFNHAERVLWVRYVYRAR